MKKKNFRLDGKSGASIILGVLVCFFMVTVFAFSNNLKTSYALPTNLDAKDISEVKTKLTPINIAAGSKFADSVVMVNKFTSELAKIMLTMLLICSVWNMKKVCLMLLSMLK